MLCYEIAYGGRVVELSETKVTTKTQIMNCVDYTDFSGPKEEMEVLVAVAALCVKHDARNHPASFDAAAEQTRRVTGGNPLLVKLGGDYILGQFSIRNVLAAVLGFEDKIEAFSHLSLKDAIAAAMLAYSGDCSIDEALELASAKPVYGLTGEIVGLQEHKPRSSEND